MRAFSIILEEEKREVPIKWLSEDRQSLKWPPNWDMGRVRKAIISLMDPQEEWISYPESRVIKTNGMLLWFLFLCLQFIFIKISIFYIVTNHLLIFLNYKDDYIRTTEEMDPSDIEKIKSSRKNRKRKQGRHHLI